MGFLHSRRHFPHARVRFINNFLLRTKDHRELDQVAFLLFLHGVNSFGSVKYGLLRRHVHFLFYLRLRFLPIRPMGYHLGGVFILRRDTICYPELRELRANGLFLAISSRFRHGKLGPSNARAFFSFLP